MNKETAKIWYGFLRLADRMKLPVDWSVYKSWGTPEEIRGTRFETWWRLTGRELYPLPDMLVVEDVGAYVVVRVPKDMPVYTLRRAIAKVMKPYRDTSSSANRRGPSTTGLVRQKELRYYYWLLDQDVRAGRQGVRIKDLLQKMQDYYRGYDGRAQKANPKMRANAGGKKRVRQFKIRGFEKPKERVGRLWLKKGEQVAKNVATGIFPGEAYRNR